MNNFSKTAVGLMLFVAGASAQAASCRVIHWKPDSVLQINSALYLGTRVELPADNLVPPVPSSNLWDTEGAANQVLIKPNSDTEQGKTALIRIWTTDGNAYDIAATRSTSAQNEACVKIVADGMFFTPGAREALNSQSSNIARGAAASGQQVQMLQTQLARQKQESQAQTQKAVYEALRRFRYHVYTGYSWNQGKGFEANGLVTDVYDDGRFTYIRLDKPNRGLMSVETVIGGKTATVPTKYDDAYGMYVISGIYPSFKMKMDDSEMSIERKDNKTLGEF
ncbi:TrbG/VirB9 family P-type conjugative transfer protein [Pseudomonas savastanoi]|uniref:TrbG/VirB9 family P-type conjugative transfer protein n=1 Tax=Pseudomonas savastanoi TaxID=29438 RepID=UPI000E32984E|nr:TrbG/VirB9 family P-type conjugative transfer protein [Pseudomonas savastanoi]